MKMSDVAATETGEFQQEMKMVVIMLINNFMMSGPVLLSLFTT